MDKQFNLSKEEQKQADENTPSRAAKHVEQEETKGTKTFKVTCKFRVNKCGFFDNQRVYNGDTLMVTEKQFSKRWMVRDEVEDGS